MRYRSIHTLVQPQGYTLDDLRAAFTYVTSSDSRVSITRHGRNAPLGVTVEFSANSDALAKQISADIRREATILGATDHLATQVKTRQGWKNL